MSGPRCQEAVRSRTGTRDCLPESGGGRRRATQLQADVTADIKKQAASWDIWSSEGAKDLPDYVQKPDGTCTFPFSYSENHQASVVNLPLPICIGPIVRASRSLGAAAPPLARLQLGAAARACAASREKTRDEYRRSAS